MTEQHAALGTLQGGHPYVSLVAYALDGDNPVFLLSELAEHTKNLRADARASLLITDPGEGDPLARGRRTLIGRCVEVPRPEVEAVYLAAHPSAAAYLEMKDFGFWRLEVEAVRTVGGFGVMGWTRKDR